MINLVNTPNENAQWQGVNLSQMDVGDHPSKFALTLYIQEKQDLTPCHCAFSLGVLTKLIITSKIGLRLKLRSGFIISTNFSNDIS